MLIKDLKEDYPLVYEAAMNNFDTSFMGLIEVDDNTYIEDAFSWAGSPEKDSFWNYIEKGNFNKAKEICPHLFEDAIPEYVECIYTNNYSIDAWTKGKIYKIQDKDLYPKVLSLIDDDGIKYEIPFWNKNNLGNGNNCFKPSTKKAYGAQNMKEKSLVGRYLKVLKDNACYTEYPKGHYTLIKEEITKSIVRDEKNMGFDHRNCDFSRSNVELMPEGFNPDTESNLVEDVESLLKEAKRRYPIGTKIKCNFGGFSDHIKVIKEKLQIENGGITHWGLPWVYKDGKWAEIVEEPKAKPKPNYKGKVVHVDTQEKWDFVTKNLGYDWTMGSWGNYGINTFIALEGKEYGSISSAAENNYQILSFDEYLSLNLLEYEWMKYLRDNTNTFKKDKDEFPWDELDHEWKTYPVTPKKPYQKDKFMEPIKVKPYTKSKSRIKLIF